MKKLRILIVEDDVVARIALESVLTDIASVAVIAKRSVAGATEALGERFDFAFLDVNVADGETFGLAAALTARGVPLAFMGDGPTTGLPEPPGVALHKSPNRRDPQRSARLWPRLKRCNSSPNRTQRPTKQAIGVAG